MFVFPYSYPFESLAPLVVGRVLIDNYILYFSHQREHSVVDLTLLASAHQGRDRSFNHKRQLKRSNFFWNERYFDYTAEDSFGLLTSNYLVIICIVCFNNQIGVMFTFCFSCITLCSRTIEEASKSHRRIYISWFWPDYHFYYLIIASVSWIQRYPWCT